MKPETFSNFILDNHIIGFFDQPIPLKSGRQSYFYVNWRRATNDAFLLNQLTDQIAEFLSRQNIDFDCLIGVPEGASKTAVVTSLKLALADPELAVESHIVPMARAKPKNHGAPQDKYFVGAPSGKTIVLEDTITTGLSLVEFLDNLIESGTEVVAAVALTDRMEARDDGQSVADYIEERYQGVIKYLTMSQAPDLIKDAINISKPSSKVLAGLQEEFNQFSVRPLDLGSDS